MHLQMRIQYCNTYIIIIWYILCWLYVDSVQFWTNVWHISEQCHNTRFFVIWEYYLYCWYNKYYQLMYVGPNVWEHNTCCRFLVVYYCFPVLMWRAFGGCSRFILLCCKSSYCIDITTLVWSLWLMSRLMTLTIWNILKANSSQCVCIRDTK